MSLRIARYLIAVCDRCGPGWWASDPACGSTSPHFLSELCAMEQLAADYGWIIRHRIFGETVMTCRGCSRNAAAQPPGWLDRVETWLLRALGTPEATEGPESDDIRTPGSPQGHSDATSNTALTAEQEQLLAELDARLSGDNPLDSP
jgi:hypothetical protein